jgi:uncharacterized membrane protein
LRMTITFLLFVIVSILLLFAYYILSYKGGLSLISAFLLLFQFLYLKYQINTDPVV